MGDNRIQFLLDAIDRTQAAFDSIKGRFGGLQTQVDRVNGAVSNMTGAIGGISAAIAGSGLVVMVQQAIAAEAALHGLSERTGLTVETLSALKGVAKLSGTSMDDVAVLAQKLNTNMLAAAEGNEQLARRFAALGIKVVDSNGRLRDGGQIMQELSQKLLTMDNRTQSAAIRNELMGKSAGNAASFLNDLAEAGQLHARVTSEQAAEADKFEKNLAKLRVGTGQLGMAMANTLLPSLTDITEAMIKARKEGGLLASIWSGIKVAAEGAFHGGETNPLLRAGINLAQTHAQLQSERANLATLESEQGSGLLGKFVHDKQLAAAKARVAQLEADLGAHQSRYEMLAHDKQLADAADANKKTRVGLDTPDAPAAKHEKSPAQAFLDQLTRESLQANDAIEGKFAALREHVGQIAAEQMRAGKMSWGQFAEFGASADELIEKLQDLELAKRDLAEQTERDKIAMQQETAFYDAQAQAVEDLKTQTADWLKDQEFQVSLVGKTALQQQVLTKQREIDLAIAKQMVFATDEQRRALTDLAETLKGDVAEAFQKSHAAGRTWEAGMSTALDRYIDETTNAARATEQAVTRGFSAMEDGLTAYVRTGKLSFSSLADSIINDMIRMQMQANVTAPLAAALPGLAKDFSGWWNGTSGGADGYTLPGGESLPSANGNVFANGSLMAFADGGMFTRPTYFPLAGGKTGLAGEAGPEAIMPLTRDSSGRLGVRASGGSDVSTIKVEIENNGSPQEVVSAQPTFDPEGMVIRIVTRDLRTGGPIAGAMANTYGLRRAGV